MANKRVQKKRWKRGVAKVSVLFAEEIMATLNHSSFTEKILHVKGQEPPTPPAPRRDMTPREFKMAWRKALKGIRSPR